MKEQAALLLKWLQDRPGTVCLVVGYNGSGKTLLTGELDKTLRRRSAAMPTLWVREQIQKAFPGLADGSPFSYSVYCAVGLLMDAEGAEKGSTLAFDDAFEGLHPHSVRALFWALKEKAEEKDIRIVLLSQNLTLMDQFRDNLEEFFSLEDGKLRALMDDDATRGVFGEGLHNEDWLAQTHPSNLYDQLEFGSPLKKEVQNG